MEERGEGKKLRKVGKLHMHYTTNFSVQQSGSKNPIYFLEELILNDNYKIVDQYFCRSHQPAWFQPIFKWINLMSFVELH